MDWLVWLCLRCAAVVLLQFVCVQNCCVSFFLFLDDAVLCVCCVVLIVSFMWCIGVCIMSCVVVVCFLYML